MIKTYFNKCMMIVVDILFLIDFKWVHFIFAMSVWVVYFFVLNSCLGIEHGSVFWFTVWNWQVSNIKSDGKNIYMILKKWLCISEGVINFVVFARVWCIDNYIIKSLCLLIFCAKHGLNWINKRGWLLQANSKRCICMDLGEVSFVNILFILQLLKWPEQ